MNPSAAPRDKRRGRARRTAAPWLSIAEHWRAADMPVAAPASMPPRTKNRLCVTALLVIMMILLQGPPAFAQDADLASPAKLVRDGRQLLKSDVERLESSLNDHPDDVATRTKLLGFYFHRALPVYGHDATIEARRNHIFWFIEHHPESAAMSLGEATIDAKGHALADALGYERASTLWMEQTQRHAQNVAVLEHAVKFFQLSDKDRAASLLRHARDVEPNNRQLSALTGYVYALGILGVTMMNQNGLPNTHDPAEAKSDFAVRAVDELRKSSDAAMVGVAGQVIGQYGLMLSALDRGAKKFTVDYAALSETFLGKAQELDPTNPHWSQQLEQLRTLWPPVGGPK
jgi:hypothetical protein